MTTLLSDSDTAKPWGFWATLGFSLLAFFIMSAIQGIIIIAYGMNQGISFEGDNKNTKESIKNIALDGDLLGLAEIPSALVGVGLILWFSSLRKPLSVKNYLHLKTPKISSIFKWLGMMFIVMIAMQMLTVSLGIKTPQFMTDVYGSTDNKLLLWTAVVIAAPFFEEFLFRGFLFEGLQHSLSKIISPAMGTTITVIFTAGIWAIIHMQYGWFEILNIFAIGIVLAIARLKTGSLFVPIAMHMMMNLLASIAMEFQPELEKAAAGFIVLLPKIYVLG